MDSLLPNLQNYLIFATKLVQAPTKGPIFQKEPQHENSNRTTCDGRPDDLTRRIDAGRADITEACGVGDGGDI